jgi:hypothetical protein
MTDDVRTNVGPDQQDQAHDLAQQHARDVAERARLMQESLDDLGVGNPFAPKKHEPGAPHEYEIRCKVCHQPGVLRVTVDPDVQP